MSSRCQIIGVLDNGVAGLDPAALSCIKTADILIGGNRTLSLFSEISKSNAEHKNLTGCLKQVPEWVSAALTAGKNVVVLATGDPLCHGIGRHLLDKVGAASCKIRPNTSTLQLACARLGLAWQSAHICSVHSKDTGEWHCQADRTHGLYPLLQACQQHDMLAIFTSPENTPERIARLLQHADMADAFSLSVAEKLLTPDETIHAGLSINAAASMSFGEPNIVILLRQTPLRDTILFGHADSRYAQRKPNKGLITKREVRAVSLARLQLTRSSIVWDIGAGSGSVGLEAAQLCPTGYVYAIEKNIADAEIVQQNQSRFGIHNFKLFMAKAPEHLDAWPAPDAVFIGGSGGKLDALITLCLQRLNPGGWLVMNFVTLENLNTATESLKQSTAVNWDVTQLQASRSQPILHMQRMQAENPVWIVCAQAPADSTEAHHDG
ncbi:Cobalt-precorrin-7 (C5)-methyltransferase / Cobalt-precorrin-6B C15-methyltransferase [decarboxylating] [hydrothermal vent metagenome]|uniref:Cobalt-precorrin-7 (C5)-methyltransferase / Cobalt-precorrin-6B C15-methyltransferase [decarboxylating] n=1 Tax=hydrothermal vent metagenome TaxID=652676 RepID=A0A3B0YJC6_9ZZZZ